MLSVNSLSVTFGQTKILSDLSFSVQKGETVGIIGPNGSGKTTLFNSLCGFIQPSAGTVIFKGEPLLTLPPYERARRGIGRVFQNFGIFKNLTAEENIILALESSLSLFQSLVPSPKRMKRLREEAGHYLDSVSLGDKRGVQAGSLSGGQMRLLEIARIIALNAELFLLDEPTAGVSPRLKEDVSKAISTLIDLGKTVLVIEHDMNFIKSFVQRIIVLEQGKVFMDDKPQTVMESRELREIYFGAGA